MVVIPRGRSHASDGGAQERPAPWESSGFPNDDLGRRGRCYWRRGLHHDARRSRQSWGTWRADVTLLATETLRSGDQDEFRGGNHLARDADVFPSRFVSAHIHRDHETSLPVPYDRRVFGVAAGDFLAGACSPSAVADVVVDDDHLFLCGGLAVLRRGIGPQHEILLRRCRRLRFSQGRPQQKRGEYCDDGLQGVLLVVVNGSSRKDEEGSAKLRQPHFVYDYITSSKIVKYVPSVGIEPTSQTPQARVLSIEL